MTGVALILATAVALALLPAVADRWAARRGASPATLSLLALLTVGGLAALPLAFAVCTATLAEHEGQTLALRLATVAGLLLVGVGAGRALAKALAIRRRWSELARVASALAPRPRAYGIRLLPVEGALAFVAGTDAYLSQGLIDRLSPLQQRAVAEHERAHAAGRHGRLVATAQALSHALFGWAPARRAEAALRRELDAVADRKAVHQLGDAGPVREALLALAPDELGADPGEAAGVQERLARLAIPQRQGLWPAEGAMRVLALVLAALIVASICVSFHAGAVWLGALTCAAALIGFASLVRPLFRAGGPPARPGLSIQRQEEPIGGGEPAEYRG